MPLLIAAYKCTSIWYRACHCWVEDPQPSQGEGLNDLNPCPWVPMLKDMAQCALSLTGIPWPQRGVCGNMSLVHMLPHQVTCGTMSFVDIDMEMMCDSTCLCWKCVPLTHYLVKIFIFGVSTSSLSKSSGIFKNFNLLARQCTLAW